MRAFALGSAFVAGVVTACGGGERASVSTVAEARIVANRAPLSNTASTAERLGVRAPAPARRADDDSGLAWDLPRGWSVLPPGPMRVASFRVAGDARAECWLSLLGGDGGGLKANLDRWRTQMGLAPISVAELDALPRHTLLGGEGVLVDCTGKYTGMGAAGAATDARMLGLARVEPGGSAFLKLIGPSSVVAAERDAFLALARSLRVAHEPATDSNGAALAITSAQLAWKAPEGWVRAPDRATRVLTLLHGGDEDVECYVTTLPGAAGGVLANVNRWRGQLGAAAWSEEELARA
ncbi:MAG: hypothetical protein HZA53_11495, partial [Planctomycetes bacterium]|nr:hypothetical protein [Planctomycetota bacterium]